jgi:dihydrofolate reductase
VARISVIAALARNRVIGRDGGLPWHLPDDMRHFMRTTRGKTVVMGRRTFESLSAPLADRENVVVTRRRGYAPAGATVVRSLAEALERFAEREEIVIAGGERIYREALDLADRLYLTYVDAEPEGDTHFPVFDPGEWREVSCLEHPRDARHPHPFRIVTLERRPGIESGP